MYGTAIFPRTAVVPGMLIKHNEKYWRASANNEKWLYLRSLSEAIRINNCKVEVALTRRGLPDII